MLVPTRTARVSGTVFDGQGRPVKQGSVMLMPRNPSGGMMASGGGMIRPDGTFTINGVSPGEYTLRGNLPGPPQPGVPMEMATANVTVNGIDITDVRVEPVRPITVSGHVVLDPVAARSFKPETMRLSAPPSEPGPVVWSIVAASGGSRRFDVRVQERLRDLRSSGWRHHRAG